MKIKSYILVIMLIFLISCAEEGPFTMGKLEYNVEASGVTPTTATVKVSIPQKPDNIITTPAYEDLGVYLVDKKYNYPQQIDNLIYGVSSTKGVYHFSKLTPNTTYYVVIKTSFIFNGSTNVINWQSFPSYVFTGYSFTTMP